MMPSFYIVVAPDGHHEDAPGRRRPGVVADPRLGDVLYKLLELVCFGLRSPLVVEHALDFIFG